MTTAKCASSCLKRLLPTSLLQLFFVPLSFPKCVSLLCMCVCVSGLNQVVSEQAVDGPSPLDTMIQRLQQEQDQRLGTNDTSATANTRTSRGIAVALIIKKTKRFPYFLHCKARWVLHARY